MSDSLDKLRAVLERRYTISRELGRGGMSAVFAAFDRRHARDVAIKVLPPALASAIGPERFQREIAITSRLSHPHILPLFDSGQAAGVMYYVMPLINGMSLRSRLDIEKEISESDAITIASQLAGALDHAHSMGVIHRDVSPDNILLSDGNALLADFGVARLVDAEALTESGLPFGTAMYRSPEQAAGHAKVGPESDVYSLACVLYEALGGPDARINLVNRFASPVASLRKLRPAIAPAVDAAIAKAMSLDPGARFKSAGEFARALTRRAPFRWDIAGRIAASIALVVAVTAGLAALAKRTDKTVSTRVIVGHFANRTGDKELDDLGEMTTDYIARGLAQTGLLDVIDSRTLGSLDQAGLGAGTRIDGSIYRHDSTLHVEARITDPRSGRLLISTAPVESPVSNRTTLAEQLRQRLMGNFAALFGPGFEAWEGASLPPSYDAYQEILAGDAAVGANDYASGKAHYLRAAQMDSSYTGARAMTVMAASIENDCNTVDSITRALRPRINTLATVDRGRIEWGYAQCHGDFAGALETGKRVLQSAPRSISFALLTGVTALELLRPDEARRILESVSPDEMQFTAAQRQFRTSFIALAWHIAGDYKKELATYRDGLRSMPDEGHFRSGEIIALAALGRADEIDDKLFTSGPWTPSNVELCAATELDAHGFHARAMSAYAKASELFMRSEPDTGVVPVPVLCTERLFIAPYYAGRLDYAQSFYAHVLARDSTSFEAHDALGAIAARKHDAATTAAMDRWLAAHQSPVNGWRSYSRARLAALSHHDDQAMQLLAGALREGMKIRMNVHADPDFQSLRKRSDFQQLFGIPRTR